MRRLHRLQNKISHTAWQPDRFFACSNKYLSAWYQNFLDRDKLKSVLVPFFLFLFTSIIFAQTPQPPATTAAERLKGYETRKTLEANSLYKNVEFESVGPTVFGGRIVDLDVNPADPTIFYAAYASGGLWYTKNNGTTFEPLFQNEAVMTIGDIAVNWKTNHIWIGSGENNSSRSSYAGLGMYKSEDGGKTWSHKGLPESHHIGRIVLHPTDPNTLWVGVLGHLYSPNKERGVYKTTDGGNTWSQVLFVNENAGAVDLMIDPQDPTILYAGIWERERRAWNFVEAGLGSGIYKSTDGGDTWSKTSGGKTGFPSTKGTGRIGLGSGVKDGKTILYAILDNYDRRLAEDKDKEEGLTKDDFRVMSKEKFAKLSDKEIDAFLKKNSFPDKYSAAKLKEQVAKDELEPLDLVEYLEDANSLLFDTPVIGAQLYMSENGGANWKKTHAGYLDDLHFSYGYYFAQVRPNPKNPDQLYVFGVPVLRSDDGGKNFVSVNGENVHVDHHACWVNPERDGHVIIGNDGGVNISFDSGESWIKCNSPAVGQFYSVTVDDASPYNIYGGLQDNGVWKGPSNYEASSRWHAQGDYPYNFISGGDGMQVAVDLRDNTTIYTGFQFGNYFRINRTVGERKYITPKHDLGERPFRWNWQAPIQLSSHNQDIFYMGSNKLHRSLDQGNTFEAISDDLTKGGIKGDVAYSTLTSIHESPMQFGLLYAGSDDGLVHCTKDGGVSWTQLNNGLPENMWVTKIQASQHEKGRVYLSMNGYRWDDFSAYAFVSENYGATWKSINTGLPLEPINIIKEDKKNEDLLYVGTDHGLYISMDRGNSWSIVKGNLPAVAVHDIAIHEESEDIILGTHGRSFWKGSLSELRQLTPEIFAKALYLFPLQDIKRRGNWGNSWSKWVDVNTPEMSLPIWSKTKTMVKAKVLDKEGALIKSWEINLEAGMNYPKYDLSGEDRAIRKMNEALDIEEKVEKAKNDQWYLPKGSFTIVIGDSDKDNTQSFEVK